MDIMEKPLITFPSDVEQYAFDNLTESELNVILQEYKRAARSLNQRTFNIFQTPRTQRDITPIRNDLNILEQKVTRLSDFLEDKITEIGTDKDAASSMFRMFRECASITGGIEKNGQKLREDLTILQNEEILRRTNDVLNGQKGAKVSSRLSPAIALLGVPATVGTIAKGIWGEKSPITVAFICLSGGAGVILAFPEQSNKAFETAVSPIGFLWNCTKNSFPVYCAVKTVHNSALNFTLALGMETGIVAHRVSTFLSKKQARLRAIAPSTPKM
jgi:hypothetical protein